MNILIVEDDKVLSLLLSRMVEKMEYTVVGSSAKGREAIEKATRLSPDLILMDIMLEDDVDGIDAMLELRKQNNDVPVIFITGNSDPYNRERALETKFVDYLIKPVNFKELKSSVSKIEIE